MKMTDQLHVTPGDKTPGIHCTGGRVGAKASVTLVKKRFLMSVMEPRSISVATVFSQLSGTLKFVFSVKHRFQGPQCSQYKASS
jgi:hypothetical protein